MASARHLLFFPLPEHGHIYPTLEVARHYVAQGCRVSYLAAPQFGPLVAEVGAQLLPLLPAVRSGTSMTGQHLWTQFAPEGRPGQLTQLVREKLCAVLDADRYDLLLIDRHYVTSFGCRLDVLPIRPPVLLLSTSLLHWGGDEHEHLAAFPTLIFCPADLEVPRYRARGEGVLYGEPSIYTGPTNAAESDAPIAASEPLVLILLGTQSIRYPGLRKTWTMFGELARRMPTHRFVASSGNGLAHREVAGGIANLSLHTHLPQRRLLQKANAVITHGGLGTLKEAILCEVPALVLPYLADQPLNAARVTAAGIGSALYPEEQTPDALSRELERLLSGEYAGPLARMAAVFREEEQRKPSHVIIDRLLHA